MWFNKTFPEGRFDFKGSNFITISLLYTVTSSKSWWIPAICYLCPTRTPDTHSVLWLLLIFLISHIVGVERCRSIPSSALGKANKITLFQPWTWIATFRIYSSFIRQYYCCPVQTFERCLNMFILWHRKLDTRYYNFHILRDFKSIF